MRLYKGDYEVGCFLSLLFFTVDVKLEKLNEELETESCEQLLQKLNELGIANVSEENLEWYIAELKKEISKKREVRCGLQQCVSALTHCSCPHEVVYVDSTSCALGRGNFCLVAMLAVEMYCASSSCNYEATMNNECSTHDCNGFFEVI